ncbi:MAG: hypothetical protein R3C49_05935 [Planctomycetaceae bacterium]
MTQIHSNQQRAASLTGGGSSGKPDGSVLQLLRKAALPLLLLAVICFWRNPAQGCPFCLAPVQTWSEMLDEADVLLLAELVSSRVDPADQQPISVLKVLRIQKGKEHLPQEDRLVLKEYIFGKAGDRVLLKASMIKLDRVPIADTFAQPSASSAIQQTAATVDQTGSKTDQLILQPDFFEVVGPEVFEYIVNAPENKEGQQARLPYYIRFLEHSDPLIAADAWGEFARSEYADIVAVRQHLSAEKLRTWIGNRGLSPERLGLYGMLLGLCGNARDAEFLKKEIGQPGSDEIRFGTEGLMGGLLLLTPEEGLKFLETSRLQNATTPAFEHFAVINALQFVWTSEPNLLSRERLRTALHPLLQQADVREIVITDLARWEDWNAVHLMSDLYQQCRTDDVRSAEAIVKYLIMCSRATEASPENVEAAKTLLESIRKQDAKTVRRAEAALGDE